MALVQDALLVAHRTTQDLPVTDSGSGSGGGEGNTKLGVGPMKSEASTQGRAEQGRCVRLAPLRCVLL